MNLPSNCGSAIIYSLVILLCAVIWWYRKCVAAYKNIPSVSIVRILKFFLFVTTPKGIPRAGFIFQRMVTLFKENKSDEGIFYCWIFQHYLFITGQAAYKFFSKEEAALNKGSNYYVFREIFGNGLAVMNGDSWKKARKIMNPVFNVSMLKDKVPMINKYANILVEDLMELPKVSLDILKHLKICTFSSIYEYILGVDVKERKKELEHIIHLSEAITADVMLRSFHPLRRYKITQYLFTGGRQYIKSYQEVRLLMRKVMLEIKESTLLHQNNKHIDETNDCRSLTSGSFARILVERHLKDESFTFDCMIDELMMFLAAGYETISTSLMFCLFLLGHHEEVQDKVYNELESVIDNNYLSSDDLSKLTYLAAVIKETVRLYPAVPVHTRELEICVQFGKYNIPKGTIILFCPYQYHRDPKYFPDPEKFFPERFLEASTENQPFTFSFSEGRRNCIGKKFAMMEMKIVLAHLLRNFKVTSLTKNEDIILNWTVGLSTVEPVYVRLSRRHEDIPVNE